MYAKSGGWKLFLHRDGKQREIVRNKENA